MTPNAELAVGDVVTLKSGGPKMTIEEISEFLAPGRREARCSWFNGTENKTELFVLESLEKVD